MLLYLASPSAISKGKSTTITERAPALLQSRADNNDKVEVLIWHNEDARAGKKKSGHSFTTTLSRTQWDELISELDQLEKRLDLEARHRKLDAI
ncbi:hypothetical protein EN817_03355 [Mesorhizobium sp. M3A.F.Ca.ET.174.01.1.1]|uniref:hypothetical protein n=1 Tax=unclassified Mesorhizobium TaxID=325217 RepID=UPI001093BE51|nr:MULTISPECIES: hypothetical protein [unclassified Mesorhizobium]TGS89395.1 hypothetical protein EN818_03355 [Mesorhizobium sp. M3A.F.Ca.ET.175.01.1.1]TGT31168.1 hypothetical protein EN817_03355 [Mesorhizobium sp. M3A.F.Ca.ET.174.01.1.1]